MLNNVWNTIKFCLRQSIRSFILFDYRVPVCLLCILNIFCALFSSHFISLSCHSLHCISHPLDWFCLQKRSTSLSWPETMNTHTALSLSLWFIYMRPMFCHAHFSWFFVTLLLASVCFICFIGYSFAINNMQLLCTFFRCSLLKMIAPRICLEWMRFAATLDCYRCNRKVEIISIADGIWGYSVAATDAIPCIQFHVYCILCCDRCVYVFFCCGACATGRLA